MSEPFPDSPLRNINAGYQPPVEKAQVDVLPGLSRSAFNLTLFVDPGTPSAKTIAKANQIVGNMLLQKVESRTLSDLETVQKLQIDAARLADINQRLSSHTKKEAPPEAKQPPKTAIARALSALVVKRAQPTTPERPAFGQMGPEATQVIAEGDAAMVLNALGVAANVFDEEASRGDAHAAENAAAMRELRSQIYGPVEPPAIRPVY